MSGAAVAGLNICLRLVVVVLVVVLDIVIVFVAADVVVVSLTATLERRIKGARERTREMTRRTRSAGLRSVQSLG